MDPLFVLIYTAAESNTFSYDGYLYVDKVEGVATDEAAVQEWMAKPKEGSDDSRRFAVVEPGIVKPEWPEFSSWVEYTRWLARQAK